MVLEHGELVEQGTPHQLIRNKTNRESAFAMLVDASADAEQLRERASQAEAEQLRKRQAAKVFESPRSERGR